MDLPVCTCCGQTLPGAFDFQGVRLTRQQTRIAKRVHRAGPQGTTLEMIIDAIYDDDPDGGALTARNVVHTQINNANSKLRLAGWQIAAQGRGAGAVFRMVQL